MPINAIKLGAVFKPDWDDRPIRVLAFDDVEVLYDSWLPHRQTWTFFKLRGKAVYYRIPTAFVRAESTFLRMEPLTPTEFAFHRPDLPLRLCRFPNLQWTKDRYRSIESFATAIKKLSPRIRIAAKGVALAIPAVVLKPFGPKGSSKRGRVIEPQNDAGFSALELSWLAHNLQAPYVNDWDKGVGIYRSGFELGIPSYYLWGVSDMAGNVDPAADG
jgi:hypothetical protein